MHIPKAFFDQKFFIIMLVAVSLAGCGLLPGAGSAMLQSDKPRIEQPAASRTDVAEAVEGNSAFALDLYHQLQSQDGNLFFSPYSISLALAMTYAGARGGTEAQMAQALHFTLPQERLHPAQNALSLDLAGRDTGAVDEDAQFRLHLADAVWAQQDHPFRPEYLDLLAENYGAGLHLADFSRNAERIRQEINAWVEKETEGRIKDIASPGSIHSMTRLALVNAIYFKANWLFPFMASDTQAGDFHLLDGSTVTVQIMHQTKSFGYVRGEDYQVIELPYSQGSLSMVILLPDAGKFTEVESTWDISHQDGILASLEETGVALSLPKFTFDSDFSLADTLAAMGMPDAFGPDADFSGMDGSRDLSISHVLHKAFVAVDEVGTEAAAATLVAFPVSGLAGEPVEVKVDRPFIFLIRDQETGTILFLGRILNPSPIK